MNIFLHSSFCKSRQERSKHIFVIDAFVISTFPKEIYARVRTNKPEKARHIYYVQFNLQLINQI